MTYRLRKRAWRSAIVKLARVNTRAFLQKYNDSLQILFSNFLFQAKSVVLKEGMSWPLVTK